MFKFSTMLFPASLLVAASCATTADDRSDTRVEQVDSSEVAQARAAYAQLIDSRRLGGVMTIRDLAIEVAEADVRGLDDDQIRGRYVWDSLPGILVRDFTGGERMDWGNEGAWPPDLTKVKQLEDAEHTTFALLRVTAVLEGKVVSYQSLLFRKGDGSSELVDPVAGRFLRTSREAAKLARELATAKTAAVAKIEELPCDNTEKRVTHEGKGRVPVYTGCMWDDDSFLFIQTVSQSATVRCEKIGNECVMHGSLETTVGTDQQYCNGANGTGTCVSQNDPFTGGTLRNDAWGWCNDEAIAAEVEGTSERDKISKNGQVIGLHGKGATHVGWRGPYNAGPGAGVILNWGLKLLVAAGGSAVGHAIGNAHWETTKTTDKPEFRGDPNGTSGVTEAELEILCAQPAQPPPPMPPPGGTAPPPP